MRIFVSEYVCSGAWSDGPLDGSLANEGRSMLLAACADFAKIPGVRVVTTWDSRLGRFPLTEVQATRCDSPQQEQRLFGQLASESDAAFVIAPEFEEILAQRRRRLDTLGARSLGSSAEAIDLCADKLRLAAHLTEKQFLTVATSNDLSTVKLNDRFPIVIKPRFGAGSTHTFLVRNPSEFESARQHFAQLSAAWEPIVQPYHAGRSLSVAVLVTREPWNVEIFPPAEQILSEDGRFHYLGGRIQAGGSLAARDRETILAACASIRGLNGYVGFDLLFPHAEPGTMQIVEINPRLTTSYLGYRVLTEENIMARTLAPQENRTSISWMDRAARFTPDGTVTFEGC